MNSADDQLRTGITRGGFDRLQIQAAAGAGVRAVRVDQHRSPLDRRRYFPQQLNPLFEEARPTRTRQRGDGEVGAKWQT